jgi:hypothetical protein
MWGGTMINDNERRVSFDELVAELRAVAPRRVRVANYAELKVALEAGIADVWDFAEMYTFQRLIAECGTPSQKQRLKETIIAGRWCTEIMLEQERAANIERNSDSGYPA